jgi:hypothetical protein
MVQADGRRYRGMSRANCLSSGSASMKTHDAHAEPALRQPAAAERHAKAPGHGAASENIDQSPRMLAQRHVLYGAFGTVFQRHPAAQLKGGRRAAAVEEGHNKVIKIVMPGSGFDSWITHIDKKDEGTRIADPSGKVVSEKDDPYGGQTIVGGPNSLGGASDRAKTRLRKTWPMASNCSRPRSAHCKREACCC